MKTIQAEAERDEWKLKYEKLSVEAEAMRRALNLKNTELDTIAARVAQIKKEIRDKEQELKTETYHN